MNVTLAAAGGIAALLFLSGCSSDSEEASAPATSATPTEGVAASEPAMTEEPGTIVEVAASNPDFETLVAAVTAAGLAETLSGEGPFTVFAPTDDAFEALPEGVLDALLLPENKAALTSILTYHVVAGEIMGADVTEGDVETLEGTAISITTPDNSVAINESATVVAVDVDASNGVIHAIDAVLVPESVDVAALTS
jgi:uncharacterized surface protein with fasciclin (FAS1) repeats